MAAILQQCFSLTQDAKKHFQSVYKAVRHNQLSSTPWIVYRVTTAMQTEHYSLYGHSMFILLMFLLLQTVFYQNRLLNVAKHLKLSQLWTVAQVIYIVYVTVPCR